MTLVAWNSFEFDTAGWSISGGIRVAGAGQSGYAAIRLSAAQTATFGINSSHVLFGFCWQAGVALSSGRFFTLSDPAVGAGIAQVELGVGSGGEIIASRSNGGTEVGRSLPGVIANDVQTYIEVRVKGSSVGAGEVEVRVNGDPTPVINATGVTTGTITTFKNASWTSPATNFRYLSAFTYIDVDATPPNDFMGHVRFGVLQPTGNGTNSDLVGSDGNSTNNYLLVDDPSLSNDGDTTYVQSPTVGDKDSYSMADLPTTALSVIGVGTLLIAKKTDAGTRGIKPVIRSGGTDYQGATEHFLSTSYAAYRQMWLQDPDGPADWDDASIAAMEVGLEVTT